MLEYDVSGPEGNVFAILANAQRWTVQKYGCTQKEARDWVRDIQIHADSYEDILDELERRFSGLVKFVNRTSEDTDWPDA